MAVVEMAHPLRERDLSSQFESFAPAISVADFWAEAGAAEMRWRHARELWSGRNGTVLAGAMTVLVTDVAVLLWLAR